MNVVSYNISSVMSYVMIDTYRLTLTVQESIDIEHILLAGMSRPMFILRFLV